MRSIYSSRSHLGQNRRGADRALRGIAAHDRARRQAPSQAAELGRRLPSTSSDRAHVQREHGAAHGQKSRLQDVERVDFRRIRPADAEASASRRISTPALALAASSCFESFTPGIRAPRRAG
jgi:hypothetical protein